MTANRLSRSSAIHPSRRRLTWLLTAVAALLGLGFLQDRGRSATPVPTGPERLTSRARPAETRAAPLAVGTVIETGAGQRRRLVLAGGTVVYVNQNTKVKVDAARKVILSAGEVYVEPAPAKANGGAFVVQTPKREVTGQGAFAVRTGQSGTSLLVTRGQAQIEGVKAVVRGGQRLTPASTKPVAAPRLSHLLGWTRDAMVAAEGQLVPGSKHAGGALVAVDPDGQEAKLSLRKYHVDVHIEDGFARTTIDQTYFNHEPSRLEGTFYFPLPADASLSRLAMYVDGNLMEGGMVERDYARQVYETILYQQRDPALLEWVDGSTFKMRVFPLEPRQEKRIVLSYTQKLPGLYGQTQYRFPAGHSLPAVAAWSFHARIKNGAERAWNSPSHTLKALKEDADLLLDVSARDAKFDKDVQLTITVPQPEQKDAVTFSTTDHDGARYLMLRYRPQIDNRQSKIKNQKDWVFLVETSGDRDPLLARVQIEVIRHLLSHAGPDDTFAVIAAGTRVRVLDRESRAVTPANVASAVAFLEGAHLIGALDLEKGLKETKGYLKVANNPFLVHLGSGIPALGERKQEVLAGLIPDGTRYVGVGVGRRWSRAFMKAASEKSGGYFTQINPDEPLGWRAFELAATLSTPRVLNVQVKDPEGRASFRVFTNALAQGEELCAIARLNPEDKTLPKSIAITGTLDGEPFERVLPVQDVAEKAEYLPRTWARLEIERLLAEDAAKNKKKIVELSKAMYVMTPFTSLLVLENEDMYKHFKVDRGRQDHWAMYPCPKKIKVVREDEDGKVGEGRKTVKQVFGSILFREIPEFFAYPAGRTNPIHFGPPILSKIPYMNRYVLRKSIIPPRPASFLSGGEVATPQPAPEITNSEKIAEANLSSRGDSHIFIAGNTITRDHLIMEKVIGGVYHPSPRYLKHPPTYIRPDEPFPLATGLTPAGVDAPDLGFAVPAIALIVKNGKNEPSRYDIDRGASPIYQRPRFSGDDRFFYDLTAYAPGLNTSAADVSAVLEAEAQLEFRARKDFISDGARKLIDKARNVGWQALTIPAEGSRVAFTIFFDGQGRYTYERIIPPGLRERVVCDGKTLLHLYPDLGLVARRTLSRFHRLDFAALVPWLVPAAEDLALGANFIRLADDKTVAIVPVGAENQKDAKGKAISYHHVCLVFGADGRLAERQVVRMPGSKIVQRQVLSPSGAVAFLDKDGKELAVRKWLLEEANPPSLKADTKDLVVLPLPYRTREHVLETLKIKGTAYQQLRFADALPLLAADFAGGNGNEMLQVFQQAFHGRDQRQLGFYVFLAACGQNLDAEHADVMSEHEDKPVGQYLALHSSPVLRKHASQWAVGSKQWASAGFLQHLAITHALYQRWQNDKVAKGSPARRKAEKDRALAYVRQNKGTAWGWGLLCLMQDRAGDDKAFYKQLADAWKLFAEVPGLSYSARYEEARCLWKAGLKEEGRRQFVELYEKRFQEDVLPAIDADFRAALLGTGTEANLWSELVRKTSRRMIVENRRPAVLALAWQCWQLEDRPLANHLFGTALEGALEKERAGMRLAGIRFYQNTGQLERADGLLQKLQADPRLAGKPGLWRLGIQLAEGRDMPSRALLCLEKALEGEFQALPEVINLKEVRADYQKLLEHYQRLADAMVALEIEPRPEFLARVVRAADRWRALDREGTTACQLAGRILKTLGDRDLRWDYLTTPVGLRPNESEPWVELARALSREGDLDLADRAYAAGYSAEPTNAQILWDRAEGLRQAGKTLAARKLFRQIAEGTWQPRFQGLKAEAGLQVK